MRKYTYSKEIFQEQMDYIQVIFNQVINFSEQIDLTLFTNTEKPEEIPQVAAVISELQQLKLYLDSRWKFIGTAHISLLFTELAHLKFDYFQQKALSLQKCLLNHCTSYLSHPSQRRYFNVSQVTAIFSALPKLPINWQVHRMLLTQLLELANELSFDSKQSVLLLGVFGKLFVDVKQYSSLILKLLNTAKNSQVSLNEISVSQLWQFDMYVKNKPEESKASFISEMEAVLIKYQMTVAAAERTEKDNKTSFFQKTITNIIASFLMDKTTEKMQREYLVGAYTLDIAFPEEKVNLEVDGIFHYRGKELRRVDKFRDFLLSENEWIIIRIPWFECPVADKFATPMAYQQTLRNYVLIKVMHTPLVKLFNAATRQLIEELKTPPNGHLQPLRQEQFNRKFE